MSGPDHETLTAALRRLADEHATGLLSVATPGADVVIELAAGTPVTIGPVHDVSGRVGNDADDDVAAAVVVDQLVDRTVAAVVDGDVEWSWDVASSAERVALPNGLVQELARRAVDAAQALQTADADAVLQPGEDLETSGELARVRGLFDGQRTVEEVAEAAGLTLPTVATMAAALVASGALVAPTAPVDARTDEQPAPGPATATWTDTVAATDDEDDEDEPELWVMGPSEDDDSEDDESGDDEPVIPSAATDEPADEPTPVVEPVRLTTVDAGPPPHGQPVDEPVEEPVDEPGEEPAAPAASASAAEWNDTSWLDDLAPQDEDDQSDEDDEPLFGTGRDTGAGRDTRDSRDALGSMLEDLQGGPSAASSPDDAGDDAPGPAEPLEREEPKAEPGDVAEFLRELSRLALDDD